MAEKMTIAQAVQRFIQACQELYPNVNNLKNFYCGIANDINRRMKEHNANCIYFVQADSKEVACQLEEALALAGFDVGEKVANGGDEDTVFVYLYRKSIFTKQ